MIKPELLEITINRLHDEVSRALQLSDSKLVKCVEKKLAKDVYFFNALSSVLTTFAYYKNESKPQSFIIIGEKLLGLLNNSTELRCYLNKLLSNLSYFKFAIKSCNNHSKQITTTKHLVTFIHTKELPIGWDSSVGMCFNVSNYDYYFTRLASIAISLYKPFVQYVFPIQDNTKGIASGKYDYSNVVIKYEGSQLEMRLEMAKYIIELIEYFKSK